jgi:hypothetical protein
MASFMVVAPGNRGRYVVGCVQQKLGKEAAELEARNSETAKTYDP